VAMTLPGNSEAGIKGKRTKKTKRNGRKG
jgi:hypothetical protein